MRISKNKKGSVTASARNQRSNRYERDEAIKCIQQAMDVLSSVADIDEVAKDSIVNLSVVLFDLKSE